MCVCARMHGCMRMYNLKWTLSHTVTHDKHFLELKLRLFMLYLNELLSTRFISNHCAFVSSYLCVCIGRSCENPHFKCLVWCSHITPLPTHGIRARQDCFIVDYFSVMWLCEYWHFMLNNWFCNIVPHFSIAFVVAADVAASAAVVFLFLPTTRHTFQFHTYTQPCSAL